VDDEPSEDDEPSVDEELLDELLSVWAQAAAPLPMIKPAKAAPAMACL